MGIFDLAEDTQAIAAPAMFTVRVDRPVAQDTETLVTVPEARVASTLAGLASVLPDLDIGEAPAIIEIRRVS